MMTHPVGEKRSNSFGLFDVHGNVCQWCWDVYAADYYKDSPMDDPLGPPGASFRAHSDNSWGGPPQWSRSTERYRRPPGFRDHGVGFRVARTVASEIQELSGNPKANFPSQPPGPPIAAATPPDEFVSLFNGKDLAGWRNVRRDNGSDWK
jgi:hypothetical protein